VGAASSTTCGCLSFAIPGQPGRRDNFGQLGFRVPTLLLSPYARPGFVDPALYDHTSVLRLIEWRLASRDRYANNIGASLVATPQLDARLDPAAIVPDVSVASVGRTFQDVPGADDVEKAVITQPQPDSEFGIVGEASMERAVHAGYFDRLGYRVRPALTMAELPAPRDGWSPTSAAAGHDSAPGPVRHQGPAGR